MVAALLLCSVAAAALWRGTVDGVARGRAQSIADITALAAVHDVDDALEVAHRNGAVVVSLAHSGDVTIARIRLGEREAVAAAELTRDVSSVDEPGVVPAEQ